MTGFVAPEPHWGRDNSDSMVLGEQAKSLPAAMPVAEGDDGPADDLDGRITAATGKTQGQLLMLLAEGEQQSKRFNQTYLAAARERSYKAYRNEHFAQSKYATKRWEGRSRLFKPKTRAFVKKSMSAAANALFSTQDVVHIEPADNSNPQQVASAALKQELINYRLDRTNVRNGIPWFQVSMGAHMDALITGVCAAKTYWKFREMTAPKGGGGAAIAGTDSPEAKNPARIVFDRPDILNIAPENVLFDPNCEWTRPAQSSSYLILRFPMPIHEVEDMMSASGGSNPTWLDVPREVLAAGAANPDDTQGTRNARTGGADPVNVTQASSYKPIWVYENFLRLKGEDWTFWTIGTSRLLSEPKPTREVYPHLFGERPVTIGVGALETYRPLPMSPVEALQPLQQEANDLTNLRLDHTKLTIMPLAKVRRGRQVDIDAVQRRSPDSVLMLNDLEDVDWDRPPTTPMDAFQETSILNNDFDELGGSFSQSSVQSNRQLNETVGGMKLMAGAANAVTEFDLRVWVETFIEPVLWQLVKLEEFYEDDAKVLAMAGNKADLIQKYGIDEITDQLLMDDVTIRVSVGVGSSDPMQGLEKFQMAAGITGQVLAPFIQAGKIDVVPNTKAIVDEVFGKAGFKNAGDRFFTVLSDQPPAPPPGAGQAPPPDPVALAKIQADQQSKEADRQVQVLTTQATLQDRAQEREHKTTLATLKAQTELAARRLDQIGTAQARAQDHAHSRSETGRSALLSALLGHHEREHQAQITSAHADQSAEHAERIAKAKPKPETRANG